MATAPVFKGMVLAAGFGQRLKPLTDHFPKPLIPFLGTNPLEMALFRLKDAGITEFAVNGHYLAERIKEFLATKPFGIDAFFPFEKDILGTGGAYNPIRAWLGEAHLIVVNGDIVSDIDLKALITTHVNTDAEATMAMLPAVIPGEKGFICAGDKIIAFGSDDLQNKRRPARNFACVQILSPAFLDALPKSGSFCIIKEGYLKALNRSANLRCHVHEGVWHDMRDPAFYHVAIMDFLGNKAIWQTSGLDKIRKYKAMSDAPVSLERGSTSLVELPRMFDPNAIRVGDRVWLGGGAEVDGQGSLESTVVLPGSRLKVHGELKNAIVYTDKVLPIQPIHR